MTFTFWQHEACPRSSAKARRRTFFHVTLMTLCACMSWLCTSERSPPGCRLLRWIPILFTVVSTRCGLQTVNGRSVPAPGVCVVRGKASRTDSQDAVACR